MKKVLLRLIHPDNVCPILEREKLYTGRIARLGRFYYLTVIVNGKERGLIFKDMKSMHKWFEIIEADELTANEARQLAGLTPYEKG